MRLLRFFELVSDGVGVSGLREGDLLSLPRSMFSTFPSILWNSLLSEEPLFFTFPEAGSWEELVLAVAKPRFSSSFFAKTLSDEKKPAAACSSFFSESCNSDSTSAGPDDHRSFRLDFGLPAGEDWDKESRLPEVRAAPVVSGDVRPVVDGAPKLFVEVA